MNTSSAYQELKPSDEFSDLIDSFWMHQNTSSSGQDMTIVPDGYLKLIFTVRDHKVTKFFSAGLFTTGIDYTTEPETTNYGCRLKILAPEFLLGKPFADVLNRINPLPINALGLPDTSFSSFDTLVNTWQEHLVSNRSEKPIPDNKRKLSQALDHYKGNTTATALSSEIFWSNRQITRYLNQYVGVSLKKYLNIQKAYHAYLQIRSGDFSAGKGYFDQAHFIKEIKKHTGATPTRLHQEQNDRFIQLKNITPK